MTKNEGPTRPPASPAAAGRAVPLVDPLGSPLRPDPAGVRAAPWRRSSVNESSALEQVVSASSALAGLLLVFLGTIASAVDTRSEDQRAFVAPLYRRRARWAVAGFIASLASLTLAFAAQLCTSEATGWLAIVLFFVSLAITGFLGVATALEI